MSLTIKPSARTRGQQIAAGVQEGRLREIPGLIDALERHEATVAEIDSLPFVESAKAERIAAAELALQGKIDAAVDAAKRDARRPFDQEEGALRAAASNGHDDAAVVARGQVLA